MGAPVIRWSSPADRDRRREIIRRAWEHAYGHIFAAAEIARIFDSEVPIEGSWLHRRLKGVGTLVAELGGAPAGLAGLALLNGAHRGELAALYVAPEHQGQGVGIALWESATAALRERGCNRMEVWTLARAAARTFYEHRGAVPIGEGSFEVAGHREAAAGYEVTIDN